MPENELAKELTLSKSELLKKEESKVNTASLASDFGRGFVQSAAIEPVWNGLGQLVSAGNLPLVSIVSEESVRSSQANNWAHKFGSAFGIAADIVLLSRGKRAIFGGPSPEAMALMPWKERALKHGLEGVKLGAFYGAVLTPSDPKENLLWGRVANAGSQAVTFGLLNYGAEALSAARILQGIKPGTQAMVFKDMGVAGLAGMPAGAAGVAADSFLRGKEFKLAEAGNAAVDFAVIGFAMAGMNHGAKALGTPDAHGVTAARHFTDKLRLTRPAENAGVKAEFRIVEGKGDFDSFYKTRLSSKAAAETTINVQQKLHGAISGIFGERFASYGETRPLLLRHGSDFKPPPAMAGSFGLIASCEPLPLKFQVNDVFPGRSTSPDASVWLKPTGEKSLILSREKLAASATDAQPVMLGLPRLEKIDATAIKVGETLDSSPHIKLTRDTQGKLWAEAKPESQGIWSRLEPGAEKKLNLNDPVYSSDLLITPEAIKAAAENGREGRVANSTLTASLKADGHYYLRGPLTPERIYLKSEPGVPVEVGPNAKFIHLGPEGILPVSNHLVKVTRTPVEPVKPSPETKAGEGTEAKSDPAQSSNTNAPEAVDPLVPSNPLTRVDLIKPDPPPPPKDRPVVNAPIEDLSSLASRLSGKTIALNDPAFRWGKFGEVVLDTARGGVDAADGTIRPVFSDYDAALSAGRFTTGIFKRRLQTDPKDKTTAPSMRVTIDEFQDPAGAGLFVPVIDINGIGKGRLVLGDDLRPLGIQNSTHLITIEQKSKRGP